MKKILTLFLAVLMVLTATVAMLGFVSCADNNTPGDTDHGGDDETVTPGEDEEGRIPLELPDKYYEVNGEKTQYHILEWAAGGQNSPGQSWVPWEEGDVEVEDGDMLGSAVFRRNAWVEQEYGVEITKEYSSVDGNPSFIQRVITNSSTSANEFQLLTLRTLNILTLIQEDLYLDMNQYVGTILHTDQPWWVQDAVESFTLGSHLYVASTEMLLRDKGATATLYFNQDLAKDYDELPNFFELVDDMEWTVEAMIDACEIVAHPNDGDDELNTVEDVWGISGGDDTVYYLYNAYGRKFAHIDDAGYIEYDYAQTPDSLTIMQDIYIDVMYQDFYFNTYINRDMLDEGQKNIFVDGNALFSSALVKDTTNKLNRMEDLYGILPHPLLDEDQEAYSSLVWVHHDSSVGIPAHVKDPEMCAIILEALSWESYYSVYPKFYETILLDRAAKDADSKRMLQVIFGSRSYDPGQYYDLGATPSGLHGTEGLLRLTSTKSTDVAGIWAMFGDKVKENMQQVNNWVADKEYES